MILTPADFIAAVDAPAETAGDCTWFIFHNGRLLVTERDGAIEVPTMVAAEVLALSGTSRLYLGTWNGNHCFAVELADEVAAPDGMQWSGLRALFPRIDDGFLALAGRAAQVLEWDRSHRFCGRCGTATETRPKERVRACPACGHASYPRLSPVVMALITRGRELLLARSPHFVKGMYSALAGFVEAGETLEECLAREVREEVGIEIAGPRYFASQPWPFPHSLMIAFRCEYAAGELNPDPSEIEDAGWFDIDALPPLPHRLSIARKLIEATLANLRRRD